MSGFVTGTGVVQEVGHARLAHSEAQLDKLMEYAEKAQTHVWIAAAAFTLSDQGVRRIIDGSPAAARFDADNLVSLSFGCYRCEQPLDRRLVDRRCPGEPA